MKHFELVKEYAYPSGSVYVLYNKKKDFYIETTSMQDVNTKGKSQEIIMTDDANLIKKNLVPLYLISIHKLLRVTRLRLVLLVWVNHSTIGRIFYRL